MEQYRIRNMEYTIWNTRRLGRFAPIFSLYSIIQKEKKFAEFIIFFRPFSKFYKNKKPLNTNFKNFDRLGPIGSAVLTFIGYKQTDTHPDKLNSYINRLRF